MRCLETKHNVQGSVACHLLMAWYAAYPEDLTALGHEAITAVVDDWVEGALACCRLLLLLFQHRQPLLQPKQLL